ncbi:MAG: hypothetical protein BZ138_03265 [Methanosphaera sp. rholeuAM270]|nr:MAG: hypothetical protein BZ138_03265 [Methanosphaera sp. rholeuAM270]
MAEGSLGRGLDSLIKKSTSKKKTQTKEKTTVNKTPKITKSDEKIEQIKKEVEKNPRISLWSKKSAACLKYLKKTTPEFSISNEASQLLDESIQKKYPEIWKLFEEE